MRTATVEELLGRVVDRDTFVEFVEGLAEERAEVEKMMEGDPWAPVTSSLAWQNHSISSFLYASLAYFDPKPFHEPELIPSWKMLAEILFHGRIYE